MKLFLLIERKADTSLVRQFTATDDQAQSLATVLSLLNKHRYTIVDAEDVRTVSFDEAVSKAVPKPELADWLDKFTNGFHVNAADDILKVLNESKEGDKYTAT